MEEYKDNRMDGAGTHRDLMANLLQIAVINKMLPKGFKFELYDTVKRQNDTNNNSKIVTTKRRKVSKACIIFIFISLSTL